MAHDSDIFCVETLKTREEITRARWTLRHRGLSFVEGPKAEALLRQGCPIHVESVEKSWDVLKSVEYIDGHLPKDGAILDLGAYASELLMILHELGYTRLSGIDLNPDLVKMPFADAIDYRVGNFHHTGFLDASFDAITAVSVIEHGFDGPRLLAEISRLLKPGGLFLASVDYWQSKVDTTGLMSFGLTWDIFSEMDLRRFFKDGEACGLQASGPMDFASKDRTITWNERQYSFAWFFLRKVGCAPDTRLAAPAKAVALRVEPKGPHGKIALLSTFNQPCGIATHTGYLLGGLAVVLQAHPELAVEEAVLVLAEDRSDCEGEDSPLVYRCWKRHMEDFSRAKEVLLREKVTVLHIQFQAGLFMQTEIVAFARWCRGQGMKVFATFHSSETLMGMCADLVNQLNKGFVHLKQSAMRFAAHGADPAKMRVVPHGVLPSRVAPDLAAAKVAVGLKADSTFITSFGFLEPHKGVLEIIEALPEIFKENPKAIFAFVGARNKDNPNSRAYLNTCQLRAVQLGIAERVIFSSGFLPEADATKLLQASDIIVMNYLINRNEISGAATFVLAHERPMVTSATPAFKQLTDCTFQISEEVGLARAVNLVLGNPQLARHLIQGGRAYARENSYEALARILLAEYGFLGEGGGSTQAPSLEMSDPQPPVRPGLWEIFHDYLDCPSTKWSHYFGIYEGHIAAFRDEPISLLEIGIRKGGSLTLWRKYFTQAAIFGADIDPACLKHQRKGVRVFIGDQADPAFLKGLVQETGDLDIVIDDGGHQMRQQIVSFMTLFPHLKEGGVYIIEGLHTSYRADYQAGLRLPGTAMEHFKGLVDCLNWWSYKETADWMERHLESVHFYDSVCVLVKKAHDRRIPITKP